MNKVLQIDELVSLIGNYLPNFPGNLEEIVLHASFSPLFTRRIFRNTEWFQIGFNERPKYLGLKVTADGNGVLNIPDNTDDYRLHCYHYFGKLFFPFKQQLHDRMYQTDIIYIQENFELFYTRFINGEISIIHDDVLFQGGSHCYFVNRAKYNHVIFNDKMTDINDYLQDSDINLDWFMKLRHKEQVKYLFYSAFGKMAKYDDPNRPFICEEIIIVPCKDKGICYKNVYNEISLGFTMEPLLIEREKMLSNFLDELSGNWACGINGIKERKRQDFMIDKYYYFSFNSKGELFGGSTEDGLEDFPIHSNNNVIMLEIQKMAHKRFHGEMSRTKKEYKNVYIYELFNLKTGKCSKHFFDKNKKYTKIKKIVEFDLLELNTRLNKKKSDQSKPYLADEIIKFDAKLDLTVHFNLLSELKAPEKMYDYSKLTDVEISSHERCEMSRSDLNISNLKTPVLKLLPIPPIEKEKPYLDALKKPPGSLRDAFMNHAVGTYNQKYSKQTTENRQREKAFQYKMETYELKCTNFNKPNKPYNSQRKYNSEKTKKTRKIYQEKLNLIHSTKFDGLEDYEVFIDKAFDKMVDDILAFQSGWSLDKCALLDRKESTSIKLDKKDKKIQVSKSHKKSAQNSVKKRGSNYSKSWFKLVENMSKTKPVGEYRKANLLEVYDEIATCMFELGVKIDKLSFCFSLQNKYLGRRFINLKKQHRRMLRYFINFIQ